MVATTQKVERERAEKGRGQREKNLGWKSEGGRRGGRGGGYLLISLLLLLLLLLLVICIQ